MTPRFTQPTPKIVGCDGVVGSAKRVDACGVCGGDNSTCRLVSGLFTRPTLPVGYNLIAQIPRGACNITISEMKHSRNYLALRRPDGSFVINGNWAINWSGEYDAGGARFTYRRQDNSGGESISSPGPLLEPVDIMVIYQQPNPGIKYEYMLPMKMDALMPGTGSAPASAVPAIAPAPVPLPPGIGHSTDSSSGKEGKSYDGTEKRPDNHALYPYGSGVLGTESQSRTPHNPGHQNAAPIGDEAHKPQPRNRGRKRKFTWKTIGFTECTKTCGGGVQTTITSCVREHNQQMVPDRRCASQERPNPQVIRCNIKPCPAEWVGGEWSECSVTCGEGIQTRNLICQQEVTATLTMKVANGACLNPTNLPRTQKCVKPPCDENEIEDVQNRQSQKSHWQVGQWGQCSVPCGPGKRSRLVQCVGPNSEEKCPEADRPANEEPCNMGSCPSSTSSHVWFHTEWTQQCSEECGTGVQTRKVYCSSGQEETCDKTSRPDDSRACSSDKLCSGKWFTGPWGQCSAQCGRGRQTRDAVCVAFLHSQYRVVLDMNCPSALKPETERVCEASNCSPEWYVSDWSPCSRDCGSGVQKREVKCLDDKQDPSAECDEEKRPPGKRACNTHDCPNSAATPGESNSAHFSSKFKDDPVLNNGAGDQAVVPTHDEKRHTGDECVDTLPNCHLVVQARLCLLYKFYRTSCCHSCRKKI
ncbi:thrombospondin type-1 domain-containing protein 4 [Anabrus simplex]|uniref:thrombospondin type-1 domain-containing protein 4 n=1 Tax=Anabrus simplex TaxID=316456 RepID=UPI0035A2A00F